MQSHYSRPWTNPNPQGAPYELPPVQSVTSSAPFQPGPQPGAFLATPSTRPSSGLPMSHILQSSAPPPTATYPPYESSVSPSEVGAAALPDAPINGSGVGAGSFLRHGGLGQHQQPLQQKRAYRQRRKDPSCDACRERKVKCDASESASCTECTNRKVRCQFTKETNRRMSSIKQVQDLEKQLWSTKQQLQQLRSGMRSDTLMDLDGDGAGQLQLNLPDFGYRPPRRPRVPISHDFSNARANIRRYGKGIWKVPTPYRQSDSMSLLTTDPPTLPPQDVAHHLLAQYHAHIHTTLPVLHWPTFMKEYDEVYRKGTLLGVTREWAAVLFGVFACGILHTLDPNREEKGKEFVRTSCGVIDVWQDNFTLDQARAALLASIFLYEVNAKSASWVWNGSAVKVAQEIGLHLESGPWPVLEGEMRKRVWWGMYAWDRLMALEMGKPVLINDQDCDIDLPCTVDEQFLSEAGVVPESQQTTPLLATIHVVRSIGQLTRTLRSTAIGTASLQTFERHFNACLSIFPEQYQPSSDQYLEPRSLSPIIYLQNARLMLHRHNVSPFCPPDVRSSALDYCVPVGQDTARLLSRCMRTSPVTGNRDWRSLLALSGSAMLCAHLWRCTLLLLFRQEFDAALVCVQASSAMRDSRVINTACGRNVVFILKCLLERLQRNDAVDLDGDEEMLAYVSGDMQGTSNGSWVWEGSETGAQLGMASPPSSGSVYRTTGDNRPAEDPNSWEGWDWIEQTVQYLLVEKEQRQQREAKALRPPPEPSYRGSESTTGSPDPVPTQPNSHSRMTIASII